MPYYVYIIKSSIDGTYYKGLSEDYMRRLDEHNAGLSQYTSTKIPWVLIYVEEHSDKRSALIRERKLKRCKAKYFEWLVAHPSNAVPEAFSAPGRALTLILSEVFSADLYCS